MALRIVPLLLLSLVVIACDDGEPRGEGDGDVDDGGDADSDSDADADADADPDGEGDADPDDDEDDEVPEEIADFLDSLEGVRWIERSSGIPGARVFELALTQPVDHGAPGGATFDQHMTLIHRDADAPFVLATSGYDNSIHDWQVELTRLLGANQLAVEHRYFGDSRPRPIDWAFLDIEQSAADFHRIVEAFRRFYAGAWIGTGASKGGMTSVYHRRFYPDDVDGTVAYVAPISFGAPDERYIAFIEAIPEPACRAALEWVQFEALDRRAGMIERLDALVRTGYSFDRVGGAEAALETVVIGLPFTFWQYTGVAGCGGVPSAGASDDEIFAFLDDAVTFWAATDFVFDYFGPYYYQAWTELGYPAHRVDHLESLLVSAGVTLDEGLLPVGVESAELDPTVMADIADWVSAEGSELMLVYGEHDPWTTGAFELGGAADSYLFVVPQGTHGAQILDLPEAERALALEVLASWTGVEPRSEGRAPAGGPPPSPRDPAWLRAMRP